MSHAIYLRENQHYVPTPWAGSPWSPEMQHGGAVNALLGHAFQQALREARLQPARIHVDLLGPVPMRALELQWEFVRRGRRTAVVDAHLLDGERPVARGTALLMAPAEASPRASHPEPSAPPRLPDALPAAPLFAEAQRAGLPKGFHLSLEMRAEPDSEGAWLYTSLDLTAGERLGDLERAMALADLSAGIAGYRLQPDAGGDPQWSEQPMINHDTCLHLERPPQGDWLRVSEARVSVQNGLGLAEVTLHDAGGRWGRCLQSLISLPRRKWSPARAPSSSG